MGADFSGGGEEGTAAEAGADRAIKGGGGVLIVNGINIEGDIERRAIILQGG